MSKKNQNRLREVLERLGISVRDASERTGVPLATVYAHCNGLRPDMGLSVARKYAVGLGVSIEDIAPNE